jgi:hypothetical protein
MSAFVDEDEDIFAMDEDIAAPNATALPPPKCPVQRIRALYKKKERHDKPMTPLVIQRDFNLGGGKL